MEQNTLKYYRFYESVLDFLTRLRYTKPGDVEGITEEEIKAFEQKNNIIIPPVIRGQLYVFGRKSIIRNVEGDFGRSLESIQKVLDWTKEHKLLEKLQEKDYYLNEDDYPTKEELHEKGIKLSQVINWNNLLFIAGSNNIYGNFILINQTEENPNVYFYGELSYVDNWDCTFIDMARNRIFVIEKLESKNEFCLLGGERGWEKEILPPLTDFTGIEWLKDYIYLEKESNHDGEMRDLYLQLRHLRTEFEDLNREWEAANNTIRTVSEFEREFLTYVRSKGYKF